MNGTVNSESLAEVIPPQGRGDMYQDVDSEEFSDFEADVHEEADIPALVKLNEEMKAMLSDEDVDEMMTYLKEDGSPFYTPDLRHLLTDRDNRDDGMDQQIRY
ncbi:hypothetical protein BN14_04468 [Rhizoctonia solani AG-1 IB]|uniref:Uncharacterized protein n=1 Tax=Thanatephorus cucumeris (strain AG1-IB / isolate 7/3/14) TaxID=1108050 RepID=M5BT97_THACB|nr:hypothetical protein BN14_04468 [Rhizoctonia solani AG-1 IB]